MCDVLIILVPHQQAAATEADIKQFLDFNRHNPLDDFSWKTANINSSKATHGWAVMYGSLFIWLFVYPCNPSCYIGRRQQMSRDISHQPVLKSHTIRGLHVHRAAATKIKGFGRWWKCLCPSNAPHRFCSPMSVVEQVKPSHEPVQMVQLEKNEHKHTCFLLLLLSKKDAAFKSA